MRVLRALRSVGETGLIALAYVGGAQVGFFLAFLHSQVSPVWPPEGISLAAVLIRGYRALPGVLLGAFLANYLHNPHLPTASLIGVGNSLSVFMAAFFIRRFLDRTEPFATTRGVLGFLTIGTMPGAAASALIGVTSLLLFGFVPEGAYRGVLLTWFTGEMQGLIIVAPFVFVWRRLPRGPWSVRRALEGAALLLMLVGVAVWAFRSDLQLTYVPIPFIVWAVFRFGFHGAVSAIMIISSVAIYHTINHLGPFAIIEAGRLSLNDSLLFLELYIGSLTVMTMLMAAAANERQKSLEDQRQLAGDLTRQRNSFQRFVPTQFIEILGRSSPEEIELGDTRTGTMSVLFSDMRSFSTISELLRPEENIQFLNSYLMLMEPAIQRHNGFVDKYVGDAIMALFPGGAGSGDQAVGAAVSMLEQLKEFNQVRVRNNHLPLEIGIGVSTGPLVLGTVGSTQRMDTTVIGDTVNLASRLESLCASYGLNLLVSADTAAGIAGDGRYRVRLVDHVTIRGRSRPVLIHEVYNTDSEERAARKDRNAPAIAQALASMEAGDFEGARSLLEEAVNSSPEPILRVLLERTRTALTRH